MWFVWEEFRGGSLDRFAAGAFPAAEAVARVQQASDCARECEGVNKRDSAGETASSHGSRGHGRTTAWLCADELLGCVFPYDVCETVGEYACDVFLCSLDGGSQSLLSEREGGVD